MKSQTLSSERVKCHVRGIFRGKEHEKRVGSMSRAVNGLLSGAKLSIHAIGLSVARIEDLNPKHTIKQIDRLMSNPRFDLLARQSDWIRHVIGSKDQIVVALDWTDYDQDGHATICLALDEGRGRATPLLWHSVKKSTLKGNRNRYEDELLTRFHEYLPQDVQVTVTADRGFADQALASYMTELGFDYIIRIRKDTTIYDKSGDGRIAGKWLRGDGRLYCLKDVSITQAHTPIPVFVSVKKSGMKAPWFLISSRADCTGTQIMKMYAKRFTIEEMFRDEKDPRFGMGLSQTRIRSTQRRDRLLFLAALARDLLTLLGQAGESIGLDMTIKANTVKTRTHSLYTQGTFYFLWLPNMKPARKRKLLQAFQDVLDQSRFHNFVNYQTSFNILRG